MGKYQDLKVWQYSKGLAVVIYKVSNTGPFANDFGLKNQIQRAAVSIPSNIAEGDQLDTNKQAIRHFYIAKGSCAELETQLIIAYEIGYLEKSMFQDLANKCKVISTMLLKLIAARSKFI